MDRLYVIGSVPPPTGGVTVFVDRRLALLRGEGREPILKDWHRMGLAARAAWLMSILFRPWRTEYELHGFETLVMAALALRPFPARRVYWIHSGRFAAELNPIRRWILRCFLGRTDESVLGGEHVLAMLDAVDLPRAYKTRFEPAFIAPARPHPDDFAAVYDQTTRDFVESHVPLLVMQGSEGWFRGEDLYGTDIALEAFARVRVIWPTAGLVVTRPAPVSASYLRHLAPFERRLDDGGHLGSVFYLGGGRPLLPLLVRVSVFLRPTADDGDSVSVREALHLGIPVVASDAVPRPAAVTLFHSRDVADLSRAILETLDKPDSRGEAK